MAEVRAARNGAHVITPVRSVDLPVGPWTWRVTWHPETGGAFGIHEPDLNIAPALISGFADARTSDELRRLADAIDAMQPEGIE